MFRTVRGFLILAPPTFVAALVAYLSAKPRAVSTFTIYPFLAEVLGSGLPRSATARFVVVTTSLLHRPLPRDRRPPLPGRRRRFGRGVALEEARRRPAPAGPRPATLSPEAFWTFVGASMLLAAARRDPASPGRPRRGASRGSERGSRLRRGGPIRGDGGRARPGLARVDSEGPGPVRDGASPSRSAGYDRGVTPDFDTVVVLDFGSQYTQLIARRIREARVRSIVLPFSTSAAELRDLAPKGIVLSGGPSSVYDEGAPRGDEGVFDLGIPVLGLCYGMQLMARRFGGEVGRAPGREYGRAVVDVAGGRLLRALGPTETVWMSHGDHVETRSRGFRGDGADDERARRGVRGPRPGTLRAPVPPGGPAHRARRPRCSRRSSTTPAAARRAGRWRASGSRPIARVREQVTDGIVLGGLSGGVDSTVAAVLIREAVGERFRGVFVDTGLLRKDEGRHVLEAFRHLGLPVTGVDASDRFFDALAGVTDPERKTKDHRGPLHRRLHREREGRRRRAPGWHRGRSTRTSSSRSRSTARPPSSRRTTTSAACPRSSASGSSSRCASSSRTRCAASARSSASRARCSTATPSRVPASP